MKPTTPKKAQILQEPADVNQILAPEKILLEALERIGRIREGRFAMHFHLSRLLPHNRNESYLRIAARVISPLASGYHCQIFPLGNGDIVVLGHDVPVEDIDASVFKLRSLFGTDPLSLENATDGNFCFFSWYEMDTEFSAFMEIVEILSRATDRRRTFATAHTPKLVPMTSMHLEAVFTALEKTSVLPMVHRQAAARIVDGSRAEIVFMEFFFSMAEIHRTIAPKLDLFANRWLFQHLTTELDRLMLASLTQLKLHHRPPIISINMNLVSLSDRRFKAFLDSLASDQSVIVEIEIADAIGDFVGFVRARDRLWALGHKILLDRLTPLSFQLVDLSLFETDYMKVNWSSELVSPHSLKTISHIRAAIIASGPERFILSRCDSEAALQWGLRMGIPCFQGRFVDAMLGAMIKDTCKDRHACTLNQCIKRRSVIDGSLRDECTNPILVDSLPTIRSPTR